jgi:hypothetical protein
MKSEKYEKYLTDDIFISEELSADSTIGIIRRVQSKLSQARDIEEIALSAGILGILACSLATENEGKKNRLNNIARTLLSM